MALENANLIQHQRNLSDELAARVSARTEELAALSAIAAEMVLQQPLPALLDRVLARTLPLLGAAAGNVRLFDRDRDALVLLAQRGLPPDDARAVAEIPVSASLFGSIVRDNQPLVIERDLSEVALRKGPSAFESLLGIPLRIGERVIGTMALLDTQPRAFAAQQIDLAQVDIVVVDDPGDVWSISANPHLAVEVLSADRSRDTVLKHHKYARAGLERYWIIDPDGPTITVFRLEGGDYTAEGRYGPGSAVQLDAGVVTLTLDPADLLG